MKRSVSPSRQRKRFKSTIQSPEDNVRGPWLELYKQIKGVSCSPTDDFRSFKSWLGVAPEVGELTYVRYYDNEALPSRKRLAMVCLNKLQK